MAITREAFLSGKFTAKAEANNRTVHPIIVFLRTNHLKAYTVKEIAKAVKLTPNGTRGMLRHLRKEGLVKHKSPYFIAVANTHKKR